MSASAAFTPYIAQFDRTLAGHLATRVAAGVLCDEPVVRECYIDTCRDLAMTREAANSPCPDEIEAFLVEKVTTLMACHQRFIGGMPQPFARAFIAELLLEQPW